MAAGTTELQRLVVRLVGDASSYQKMLNMASTAAVKAAAVMSGAFRSVGGAIANVGRSVGRASLNLAKMGLAAGAAGVGFGIKLAADAEKTQVAFKVMLGSADAAKNMMKELSDFAAATPFELPEIERSARMLLAFGYQGNEVTKTLEMFGNVAAGVGAPLDEIAELMGKNKVQGRLFMVDLNQLSGRGIPIISELAKQFGVAETEIRSMVEDGQIQYKHLERAFESLGGAGGRFAGLMEEQSKTVAGRFSTLKDTVSIALRDLGTSIATAIDLPLLLDNLTKFIGFFQRSWKDLISYTTQYWMLMVVGLYENIKFFFTDQLWPLVKAMPTLFYEAFKTILINAKNFAIALWNAIRGDGWEFQFEGLSEAFYNELNKIPSTASRPLSMLEQSLNADLDRLAEEMGKSWQESFYPAAAQVQEETEPIKKELEEVQKKTKLKIEVDPAAVRAGTEQFEKMLAAIQPEAMFGVKDKKNSDNTSKMEKHLGTLVSMEKEKARKGTLELQTAGL